MGRDDTRCIMALYEFRNEAVCRVLCDSSISTVVDFGCGDGKLLQRLTQEDQFCRIGGVDKSSKRLRRAEKRCIHDKRIILYNQSFFDDNTQFSNYEAIVATEVIEHLDSQELINFFNICLHRYMPKMLILTTPNRTYNCNLSVLNNGLRHSAHRFEFSDEELVLFIEKMRIQFNQYHIERAYCDSSNATHLITMIRKERQNEREELH